MAKRRAGGGEEKGNWLDTYADMVTLLLCFFVLLYSASSVDETKWQYIYPVSYTHLTLPTILLV